MLLLNYFSVVQFLFFAFIANFTAARYYEPDYSKFAIDLMVLQDNGELYNGKRGDVVEAVDELGKFISEKLNGSRIGLAYYNDWWQRVSWSSTPLSYELKSSLTRDWKSVVSAASEFESTRSGDEPQASLFAACMAAQDTNVNWNESGVLPDGRPVYKIILVITKSLPLIQSDHYYLGSYPMFGYTFVGDGEEDFYRYNSPTVETAAKVFKKHNINLIVLNEGEFATFIAWSNLLRSATTEFQYQVTTLGHGTIRRTEGPFRISLIDIAKRWGIAAASSSTSSTNADAAAAAVDVDVESKK